MKTKFEFESIDCQACTNSIHESLSTLQGVFGAEVDMAGGELTVEHTDEVDEEQIRELLSSISCPVKMK